MSPQGGSNVPAVNGNTALLLPLPDRESWSEAPGPAPPEMTRGRDRPEVDATRPAVAEHNLGVPIEDPVDVGSRDGAAPPWACTVPS